MMIYKYLIKHLDFSIFFYRILGFTLKRLRVSDVYIVKSYFILSLLQYIYI
jgi:hypothetical protein